MSLPVGIIGLWPSPEPSYIVVTLPPRSGTTKYDVHIKLIAVIHKGNKRALGNTGDTNISQVLPMALIRKELLCTK